MTRQASGSMSGSLVERAQSGTFEAPARVVELASDADEWPSWLSADGSRLYLTGNRGGNYDVFVATRR
jgi:hypothetical protein